MDDQTWAIRYMVVDTRNWLPGKQVLVSPDWIERVDWSDAKVYVDGTREQIKKSPGYNPSGPVSRDYETRLHDHYGRPSYWSDQRDERRIRQGSGGGHPRTNALNAPTEAPRRHDIILVAKGSEVPS